MKLSMLMQAQESGAFKVTTDGAGGNIKVGGVSVTPDQCRNMVQAIGWLRWDKRPWEVIDKTDKFIRSMRSGIDNEQIINTTEVTFQNFRISNTLKYYDRIKMVSHYFDITILYGMPGVGGTYAVFDGSNGFRQPVFNCRTAKQLAEYINELV